MNVSIVEISCYKCKVSFWITENHNNKLLKCHNSFFCPNGHSQAYVGKTAEQKIKEDRDWYKRRYQSEQETSASLSRSNAALRGVIKRNKKGSKL